MDATHLRHHISIIGQNPNLRPPFPAKRLQIVRALARPAKVLILDECTSALDPANQAAVLDTVRGAKLGHTTLMVMHKVPIMRMCDRIVLISEGVVKEQGTYEELMCVCDVSDSYHRSFRFFFLSQLFSFSSHRRLHCEVSSHI
jgi:ABC-type multidrug transport system ATPase subunit